MIYVVLSISLASLFNTTKNTTKDDDDDDDDDRDFNPFFVVVVL